MFAIDDVSFLPEKCEKIPFTDKQSRNCFFEKFFTDLSSFQYLF